MEYNNFFPFVTSYLPDEIQADELFMDYLSNPSILEQYSGYIMINLPQPRMQYY